MNSKRTGTDAKTRRSYMEPNMEMILISTEDAITTSPIDENQGPWLPTEN